MEAGYKVVAVIKSETDTYSRQLTLPIVQDGLNIVLHVYHKKMYFVMKVEGLEERTENFYIRITLSPSIGPLSPEDEELIQKDPAWKRE